MLDINPNRSVAQSICWHRGFYGVTGISCIGVYRTQLEQGNQHNWGFFIYCRNSIQVSQSKLMGSSLGLTSCSNKSSWAKCRTRDVTTLLEWAELGNGFGPWQRHSLCVVSGPGKEREFFIPSLLICVARDHFRCPHFSKMAAKNARHYCSGITTNTFVDICFNNTYTLDPINNSYLFPNY